MKKKGKNMVKLEKQLRRIVRCESSWTENNQIVLVIYPHGELGFRQPRRRAEYRISTKEAYRQAVLITTDKIAARVKELRKQGVTRGATGQARRELLRPH